MARAAVKARQQQKKATAQPQRARARGGRRKHAGGGNPNQQLFFVRMRRSAKPVYVILAVLFAATFAFLGVGSGTSGLDQLFSGLNIFHHGGTSVGKAQKYIAKHPNDPKGYRDLATAYESKGDTADAANALTSYTNIKRKDVKAWSELGGLQLSEAQSYQTAYQNAYNARQLAAPSTPFAPTGKLATAIGSNQVEQAAASQVDSSLQDLQQKVQLAYQNAVSSYQQAAKLQPGNSNNWVQLASAAQQSGDSTTAVKAYKKYLALNPESPNASQIKALIKQLSPAAPAPAKKKKK